MRLAQRDTKARYHPRQDYGSRFEKATPLPCAPFYSCHRGVLCFSMELRQETFTVFGPRVRLQVEHWKREVRDWARRVSANGEYRLVWLGALDHRTDTRQTAKV